MQPIDPDVVRKHDLPVVFRGYEREKTNVLLGRIAEAYEQCLQERKRLEERVRELEQQLKSYVSREEEFQQQQSVARNEIRVIHEAAERKSKAVMENARQAAQRLRKAEQETIEQLRREAERLSNQKSIALEKLKTFLRAQQQILEFYEDNRESQGAASTLGNRKSAHEFQKLMFDEE